MKIPAESLGGRKRKTPLIGYHASHEQFAPSTLLRLTERAEQAGFTAAMCSDHFNPWTPAQGESGYAWAWMGAALAQTRMSMGLVNAPGQRYHPAIIAQALATLAEMFPGRVWAALGTGQFLNESITGEKWPTKAERNARLAQSVDVIRALFAGETVTHHGLVVVENAKLYTRPLQPPLLMGAALTPATAAWVGSWADGLITISRPPDELAKVVCAFREGGGAGKPMFLKVQLSYAREEEVARGQAHEQWRANILDSRVLADLPTPFDFERAAGAVRPEDLDAAVRISNDPARHLEWLREDLRLGFDRLFLHNVNRQQEAFIDVFGAEVLPALEAGREPERSSEGAMSS